MNKAVYVVMFRYGKEDIWEFYKSNRGGLDIQAHETRNQAIREALEARHRIPRRNVRVVKFVSAGDPSERAKR